MTFRTVPLQLAGPSYQSRSKPLGSDATINFYQQYDERANTPFSLLPFPGLLTKSNAGLLDRGLTQMAEVIYQVKDTSIYKIGSNGIQTNLGTIAGTGRCIFANDGINLIIVTDGNIYVYSSDTNAVKDLSSFSTTPVLSVDYINTLFIFTEAAGSATATFNNTTKELVLAGTLEAIVDPDDLVRDYVFEQRVWRFGERSAEAWYNSGQGDSELSRETGLTFNIGLGAINSLAATSEAFYWLGDDDCIYRARGGTEERISADAISHYIQGLDDSDQAVGYTFVMEGQNFYCINFSTKTFVLNEKLGINGWFELSSNDGKYQCNSLVWCYGKNFLADESNGNIYTFDFETYTNGTDPIKRVRVTDTIDGAAIGVKGSRIQMSKMELFLEKGVGLISGQGEDPKVLVEYSDDGGFTWKHGGWPRIGRLGERNFRVEFNNLSTFYTRMFRISITDPVSCTLFDANISLRYAGR